MKWYSKYFTPKELLSPAGLAQYEKGNLLLSFKLIEALSDFREQLECPIFCNHRNLQLRGYRSFKENQIAGGSEFSRHMMGEAADLSVYNIPFEEFLQKVKNFGRFTGIGIYPYKNFVHVDVGLREQVTIWEE